MNHLYFKMHSNGMSVFKKCIRIYINCSVKWVMKCQFYVVFEMETVHFQSCTQHWIHWVILCIASILIMVMKTSNYMYTTLCYSRRRKNVLLFKSLLDIDLYIQATSIHGEKKSIKKINHKLLDALHSPLIRKTVF